MLASWPALALGAGDVVLVLGFCSLLATGSGRRRGFSMGERVV